MDLVPVSDAAPQALLAQFARTQRLTVRQKKRWLEILTSFEAKNSYEVFDERGAATMRVEEQGQGFGALLRRVFLGPMRPFEVAVTQAGSGALLLSLHRPFRWFMHRLEVRDAQGRLLGAVQKQWSWLRRVYFVERANGGVVAELFGPLLKPWTFQIRQGDQELGVIQKRWSGLGKELFTDADNFGADLSGIGDPALKVLCFAAIVLIDVVHFERSK